MKTEEYQKIIDELEKMKTKEDKEQIEKRINDFAERIVEMIADLSGVKRKLSGNTMKHEDIEKLKFLNITGGMNDAISDAIHYAMYDIIRKDSVYRWTSTDNPIYNATTKNCHIVIGRRCDGRRNAK